MCEVKCVSFLFNLVVLHFLHFDGWDSSHLFLFCFSQEISSFKDTQNTVLTSHHHHQGCSHSVYRCLTWKKHTQWTNHDTTVTPNQVTHTHWYCEGETHIRNNFSTEDQLFLLFLLLLFYIHVFCSSLSLSILRILVTDKNKSVHIGAFACYSLF